ncbi:hypothetical protein BGZ81_009160 [Podila clonocystis]|nr:hypothetical protein BGZ81_009160 [Podila clonocystis]
MLQPTFTSLPTEIQQLIFNHLNQHDLTNCARVNRYYNTLCEPLVWKTINVDTADKLVLFQQTEARQAFLRNVTNVNALNIIYSDVFNTIFEIHSASSSRLPLCTNLLELKLSSHDILAGLGSAYIRFKTLEHVASKLDTQEHMVLLIQQNPMLQSVGLHVWLGSVTLSLVTEYLPNLCELDMYVHVGPSTAKFLLEHLPESIRAVSLGIVDDGSLPVDPALAGRLALKAQKPRNHHALESLQFYGDLNNQEAYILLPFLYSCSSKLSLVRNYQTMNCFLNPAVHAALFQIGVSMTSLEIKDVPMSYDADDEEVANIIRLSPNWKRIDLQHLYSVGKLSLPAIVDNCDHLQEIVLASCLEVTSLDLLSILCTAKNLRVFRAIYDGVPDIDDPYLAATDIVTGPDWATRSLETFACRIEVPRPDDQLEVLAVNPSWKSPPTEYCVDVNQQVFRQLARQSELRILRLGEPPNRIEHQSCIDYSLDMTLSSGMDQLAELKNLEELNVCRLNHLIGELELEWMNTNWTKLQRVTGLFNDGQAHDPTNVGWIVQHHPRWVDFHEYQLVTTNEDNADGQM